MTTTELLMVLGIPSIICVIFSSIWTIILTRIRGKKDEEAKKAKQRDDDMVLVKLACQAMLQSQLYDMGDRLVNRQKCASLLEKQCYSKMYDCYHNLGSNGHMTDLYRSVMALPNARPVAPKRVKLAAQHKSQGENL